MLIVCDKHTKNDLSIWDDYKEFDELYFNEKKMKYKILKAKFEIERFEGDYVSISWGKDSTVLAHLCVESGLPFICFRNEYENQYNNLVRDEFLKRYKINYIEYWTKITDKNYIDGILEFHTLKAYKNAVKDFGSKCILGIRQDESPSRRISAMNYGVASKNKCRPLLYWNVKDIFSYLEKFNLPVHPNYGMLGGGRYLRNQIRVGPLTMGSQKGMELWEKEYFNDILNKKGHDQYVKYKNTII